MKNHFHWLAMLLCGGVLGLAAGAATAQSDYPSRPIHLVVAQAAGGPSDLLARLVGVRLGKALGTAVIVDNRPGAGSIVGTNVVAKAPPDGYMLLLNIVETLAINETLYKSLPYKLSAELQPVGLIAASSLTLISNLGLPAKTVPQLEALARDKPGQINVGSAGVGSIMHLSIELLNDAANIKLSHIPYKGAEPAITDLLGGQVQMAFVGTPAAVPLVKQHQVIGIATTGAVRDPLLPNVPTFVEAGLPGFDVEATYGIWAPRATSKAIVSRVDAALVAMARLPDFQQQLIRLGFVSRSSSPEQDSAYMKTSIRKWGPIVKSSGATLN
jgi:tripartite-type tricarboxylate transporter receptor subunit TctC